jgi:radical SAM protein with 4Fe4S-binding SPASM domain
VIIRAKTKNLFEGKDLTIAQKANSALNMQELESGATVLRSYPRRIVLELTNACNLNCIMCGRNATDFKPTRLDMEWFRAFEPLFDTIEEVTLMGWGEPTIHPHFEEMLRVINKYTARKYFCTNGMRLDKLRNAIFDNHVDVFAVSVDGATAESNNVIRRGSNLEFINSVLKSITRIKHSQGLQYPWINYVFCAMKRNYRELPQMVEMAADVGLEEVKVVFLTAFDSALADETLFGMESELSEIFCRSEERANELGIILKLPYLRGADPAGDAFHRDCFVAYRDFFLGSDGFVRPCMSTADKFFKFDPDRDFQSIWNSEQFQKHRGTVNSAGMPENCKNCYQSSHCNWNNKKSYLQIGESFAPAWSEYVGGD